jgi:shikimate dehydrogenase
MIRGTTALVAHIGWPTHAFKAPMIYNPYFERAGIDAVVVPMACRREHYPAFLRALFTLENMRGALITMPHKVSTVTLLDLRSPAVQIAGACNAVRRDVDGRLIGDMFDGEGFVRGLRRKGGAIDGARALVVGAGGVGSAIAASLAHAGASSIGLFDTRVDAAEALAVRLR